MRDLFDELREANVVRCERDFKHPIQSWSPLEWAGAMSGEAGETANLAKKVTRGDFRLDDNLTIDGVTQSVAEHLADEVADVVIYADLLLARCNGVPLRDAIIRKFNHISKRRGSKVTL